MCASRALLEMMALARGVGRYERQLKSLGRVDLLILDDWGLAPLSSEGRRDLMEIVDDRHARRSTIITSQLPVDAWHARYWRPHNRRRHARPARPQRPPHHPQRPLHAPKIIQGA